MTSDGTTAPADPAPPPAAYCRRCGYSLRGLASGNCPECGGAFDLADRRTFARKPPRPALWRWVRRVVAVAVLLALATAAVPGWCWWQWRAEQPAIDAMRALGGDVQVRPVDAAGPARYLPERWAFVRDRAWHVVLHDLTTEQAAQVDFRPLARLERLELWYCHVSDPMLAQIRTRAELKHLNLGGNRLDGLSLAPLADCRRLEFLFLSATRLTDAGLAPVGGLTSLRRLDIGDTAVTDAGLAHLVGLPSLAELDLEGTAVTDDGLRHLRGLTSLRMVHLFGTKVTRQGRDDLRRALPNVRIDN